MSQFVVVKQGVYIQNVYGPFILIEAKTHAQELAIEDTDSYHSWDVRLISNISGLSEELYASYSKFVPGSGATNVLWQKAIRENRLTNRSKKK